jgi:hypothetical protein
MNADGTRVGKMPMLPLFIATDGAQMDTDEYS